MTFFTGVAEIGSWLFQQLNAIFALYVTIDIFVAVFVIWLVRKVLKTFNIIS